tara:strand:+ start:362 stop:580 length:219 start_codon:yes stop_codon:yes gene_type:complete
MKTTLLILFSIFSTISTAIEKASITIDSEQAFAKLKSMVGLWQKKGTKADKFQIEFSLTANDSVLVETWKHK